MNPELLQTFLKIVEYKQISQAADSLYITQAAVSNRLRRLESQLGVTLINRLKGQPTVTLTRYGEKLVPIAEQWMQLVHQTTNLKESANFHNIKVASAPSISESILSIICPLLMKEDPTLRYSLINGNADYIYSCVESGTADIGFTFYKMYRHQINTRKISEEHLMLVTNNLSEYPDMVTVDMLSRHDEIYMPWNDEFDAWHTMCWDSELQPLVVLDAGTLILPYLSFKQAWSLIPESLAHQLLLRDSNLRSLRLVEQPPALPVVAVKRKVPGTEQKELERLEFKIRSELYKIHQQ
ncbi:LysR family transcriptional regulator [Paucilactobacillus hokkaidonensis JCM 18461]|uniref:LysR family transcriptional regulator n=2 Tax=Paucilactobacillus hokkaidonensis TaxID=1193095 RepID=A0A0A1GTS7_9LACO|nr:LysR family transcriptional regulator [Paucilactobacillus hokkaidonensis]KRO09264.1 LysR family transcriptional regulator [Paucilactobacillus hokkaidonensis]BAP85405.1 LysR family transcriptional regulator [Paucilactobacillus hokkaidonensis JCM 18461]